MRTRTKKTEVEPGDPRVIAFKLELFDLLSIGCYVGQGVYLQIRRDWVLVYDSTTQKFIGRIRLRIPCLDGQAA